MSEINRYGLPGSGEADKGSPGLGSHPGDESDVGIFGLSPASLTRMALGILAIGVLWRTARYLLQFPIWGDEALLAMNFAWFDYRQLLVRLENCQIAPLLFLWGERTAFCWLGPGELSLRLLPYLAGMASLALYWHLTGLLLRPAARLFAVGFLAVAIWPVSMCTVVKPYSFDLLMSLVLLVPAAQWLRRPEQTRWLIALTLVAPVALLGSYPAVFVAGGISLALLRPAWQRRWRVWCWFAAYNLAMLAGFALAYAVGNSHLNTATCGVTTKAGMNSYWSESFPPSRPLAALSWVVMQTTGQMTAYPVGASNGGSALTVLFCIVGVLWCVRRRQWTCVILFSTPLLLNLTAALLHRYPYGGSCRLSQHLAPGICILAGLGVASLLQRASWPAARRLRWTVAATALFGLIGLGGLLCDVVRPYREPVFVWMRSTMKAMREQVTATDPVVICATPLTMECVYSWYWLNEGARVTWDYQLPHLTRSGEKIWGFSQGGAAEIARQRLTYMLRQQDPAWKLVKRIPYAYQPHGAKDEPQSCVLFCFERSQSQLAGTSRKEKRSR